jgi:ABC-type glycerol-3-phosphate transport system substrate-binding protein
MKKFLVLILIVAFLVPALPSMARADDVTLTMWTWKAFHIPGLEAVGEAFTAQTGIKVQFEMFNPDDVYRSKIQTAAQSGDMPDIVAYWSDGQWDMAASGLLVDITDKVDQEWAASFLPGTYEKTSVWTQQKYDDCMADAQCQRTNLQVGQVLSVPMAAGSSGIIFANKAMLEQAGLDPTMVPANTDEWLDMMTKVYEATGKGITIGGKFEDIIRNWIVDDLAITNCGVEKYASMIKADEGFSFTDECTQQAYGFVGQITARNLWQPGFQTLTIDEADVAFVQGEAAFDVGGSYTLGFLIQQGMDPANIHTFTLPALPTSLQNPIALAPFALIDLAVTRDSQHPAEALQFIRFFTQPDQMVQFAKITGDLPAVSISTDPAVAGQLMAGLAASYTNAADAFRSNPVWRPSVGDDVWTAMNQACNRQVTGEGSLMDSLKEVDDAAQYDLSLRQEG